jgi:anti-sigma B factor antagonist
LDATWTFERGLDGEVRMVVRGDLDIADEERLVREIDEEFERHGSGTLVVDLGEVDFVDSSAVRAFIRARRSHGARLMIGALSEPVRRVFDIAGVTTLFSAENTE